jgi:hypothetical protein
MLQSEAGYIDARPPPPIRRNLLATRGRTIHWVKRAGRIDGQPLPDYPDKPTISEPARTSH